MAEMSQIIDFPKSFILSGPYQVGMYVISASIGYAYKGQNAQGLIINWIPRNYWLQIASLLLFIHMVVAYTIKNHVLCRALHRAFSPKTINHKTFKGTSIWGFCTLIITLSAMAIANTIPFFNSLTGLIGATLTPMTVIILPISYYYLCFGKQQTSIIEKLFLFFLFILGIAFTISGTYSNMKDIVQSWDTYGAPWSCTRLGQ